MRFRSFLDDVHRWRVHGRHDRLTRQIDNLKSHRNGPLLDGVSTFVKLNPRLVGRIARVEGCATNIARSLIQNRIRTVYSFSREHTGR